MHIGNRVKVNSKQEYGGRFYGARGTILRTSKDDHNRTIYGVRLDDYHNTFSHHDVFWFPKTHIQKLYDEPDINISELSESEVLLMPDYKTVLIHFKDGPNANTNYAYACYDDVKTGDTVVVHTGHHGFSIAQVADAEPVNPPKVQHNREVVCKVDFTNFEARKAKAQRAAELKAQMDEKVQQLQSVHLYEMMASKDPALAAMLAEYKTLNGMTDIGPVHTDGSEDK